MPVSFSEWRLLHALHGGIQSAFVPGGLIFVNNALVRHAINDRNRFTVGSRRSALIAAGDGRVNFFNVGAHHRTEGCIVSTSRFPLTGSLRACGELANCSSLLVSSESAPIERI